MDWVDTDVVSELVTRRSLIVMTENPDNRKSSRHVDTHKHFIGKLVEDKTIIWDQCGTMVEDIQYYHGPGIPFVKASMNVVYYFVNTKKS